MVYHSYKVVRRDYDYAQRQVNDAKASAVEYLKEVAMDAGSVGIMVDGKPALLCRKGDTAVIYNSMSKPTEVNVNNYGFEQLVDICEQVNKLKIVEEYESA